VYYGAPGFYYQVGYRKKDENSNADFAFEKITKNLTYAREFEIPSPGVDQKWEFFVQSGNDMGLNKQPTPTIAVSGDKSMLLLLFYKYIYKVFLLILFIKGTLRSENNMKFDFYCSLFYRARCSSIKRSYREYCDVHRANCCS